MDGMPEAEHEPGMGGTTEPMAMPEMNGGMGGMNMGMDMGNMDMMAMYFHAGYKEYILFMGLLTKSEGAFAGACIVVFVLAVLYELLKFWREELQRRHMIRLAYLLTNGTTEEKKHATSIGQCMMSGPHLLQTILHAVQILLSYCLMLLFMTYNAYLALCIVLGAACGYFLVGWKRTQIQDSNEHCH